MSHGLMFHHFYDKFHPKGQGAISSQDFRDIINYVGRENILPAEIFLAKATAGTLEDNELCLTFDDALLCQFEIAYPVMRDMGLTAFWFVYSSVLEGNIENLEVYRYFRTKSFDEIDEFYNAFFDCLRREDGRNYEMVISDFEKAPYLQQFAFYTDDDRKFRYLRDVYLGPKRYEEIMDQMIEQSDMKIEEIAQNLWMSEAQLKTLNKEGHIIGLHSYSHPTKLSNLSKDDQYEEYSKNYNHLQNIVGTPTTSSHPCNSYNSDTIDVLQSLGIKLSFCSNMAAVQERSIWELPREDHTNILKQVHA